MACVQDLGLLPISPSHYPPSPTPASTFLSTKRMIRLWVPPTRTRRCHVWATSSHRSSSPPPNIPSTTLPPSKAPCATWFLCWQDSPDEDDEDKNVRYLSHLTIPAAFVTKTTGDILKALITTGTAEQAYVIMDWTDVLPRASKVKWQFWSG